MSRLSLGIFWKWSSSLKMELICCLLSEDISLNSAIRKLKLAFRREAKGWGHNTVPWLPVNSKEYQGHIYTIVDYGKRNNHGNVPHLFTHNVCLKKENAILLLFGVQPGHSQHSDQSHICSWVALGTPSALCDTFGVQGKYWQLCLPSNIWCDADTRILSFQLLMKEKHVQTRKWLSG